MSSLLGALLTTGFAQAAQARATIPEDKRRDFTLYIDEFQNFTTTSLAGMLAEARKYRLSLVMAHQFLSQVPDSLQDAVIGTASTTIVFRCGATDAERLAPEFNLHTAVEVNDTPVNWFCEHGVHTPLALMSTPNFEAWVRTIEDGRPSNPRRIRTRPPGDALRRLEAVRNRTRARYARPRAKVEREIAAFIEHMSGRPGDSKPGWNFRP
jgi:hypothetical protein